MSLSKQLGVEQPAEFSMREVSDFIEAYLFIRTDHSLCDFLTLEVAGMGFSLTRPSDTHRKSRAPGRRSGICVGVVIQRPSQSISKSKLAKRACKDHRGLFCKQNQGTRH